MGRPRTRQRNPREPEICRAFAERLKKLIEHGAWDNGQHIAIRSQRDLARLVPTSPGEVGLWLNGERTPTLYNQIERLCVLFRVDPGYLMFGRKAHEWGKINGGTGGTTPAAEYYGILGEGPRD